MKGIQRTYIFEDERERGQETPSKTQKTIRLVIVQRQMKGVYLPNKVRPKANSGFGTELLPKICSRGDKTSSTTACFPILSTSIRC